MSARKRCSGGEDASRSLNNGHPKASGPAGRRRISQPGSVNLSSPTSADGSLHPFYLFEVRFIDDEDERTHPEVTPGFTYHECVNRFAEELVALVRCEVRPNEGKEARIKILFYYGPSAVERWNAIQEDNETSSGEPRWA
jgi:hypothetical protein